MLDPITQMLLAQAIPSAINLVKSGVQSSKANQLSKSERPQYNIPQAILDQVQQAKYLAGMRELPGQNLMEGRLGANTAKGVAELKNVSANPADLASNVARLYGAQNDATNNIGMAAGQQWLQNQGILQGALGQLGQYQDKQFNINRMQPYLANKAAESALREGSFRNLSAAGENIASGIGGAVNYQTQQDQLNQILEGLGTVPQGNVSTTTPMVSPSVSVAPYQSQTTSLPAAVNTPSLNQGTFYNRNKELLDLFANKFKTPQTP